MTVGAEFVLMCFTKIKLKKKDAKVDKSTLQCGPPSPPERVPASNFQTHPRPDLNERGKKNAPPGATETRETLEEMGLVVGQVLVRMSQARNNMVLTAIDSVLVLLVLTHICARWILNLELLPQFNWRIPLAN